MVGGRGGGEAHQLIGDEGLDMLAGDGGNVGRHAGFGQEARQQCQPVEVGALSGRRHVGGAQVAGGARGVGGQVAAGTIG